MRGPHCLKTWNVIRGPIARSSAEAEHYPMLDGVVKAFGVQSLGAKVVFVLVSGPVRSHTDSSSVK